ncbi:sybindin-like family protein [Paecilomyces variotii No. 5]|uniref:Trafficking protein particle complex subunit n=1 Tax=Byssochlamys spectabilis (strain No. 5 / NBRC 109023) TaxID=1356009 RepID=V5I541_BYSSN|nr:sybindin-like family protein [Paecilomyces variotii No. 5]
MGELPWSYASPSAQSQLDYGVDGPSMAIMTVYSLIIINKAGGLIYQRDFQAGLRKLSTNDYLVLAGTFHGYVVSINFASVSRQGRQIAAKLTVLSHVSSVHAITRSLTPHVPSPVAPATTGTTAQSSSGTSTPTPGTVSTLPNPGVPKTGIEVLESEKFRLTCFQTLTGTKFLLFTDPLMPNVDVVMRKVYELYADYVMKNPFYQLEMPVRCEAFDRHLAGWLRGRA